MRSSIRKRLTVAFIGLAIGPLLLVGAILAWQSFTTQEQQALNLQREVAQRVSTQVTAFFAELENELHVVSQVRGLQGLDRDRQRSALSELLLYQDVFEALVLLDSQGQEQLYLSRFSLTSDLVNRAGTDEFVIPQTQGQVYYSPVRFEEITGEPFVSEALALVISSMYIIAGIIVVALAIAGSLGFLIVRQIVWPIQTMATAAQAISAGDLSQQVKITGQDELGILARAFNSMTSQLRELIDSLEQRVAGRTRRLEILATIGGQLNAALKPETLPLASSSTKPAGTGINKGKIL